MSQMIGIQAEIIHGVSLNIALQVVVMTILMEVLIPLALLTKKKWPQQLKKNFSHFYSF